MKYIHSIASSQGQDKIQPPNMPSLGLVNNPSSSKCKNPFNTISKARRPPLLPQIHPRVFQDAPRDKEHPRV